MPKPLMCSDKALYAFPPVGIWRYGAAGQHGFQDAQQLFGDLVIPLVAGMMEG